MPGSDSNALPLRRFLPALALVLLIAVTAPVMGEIRDVLFESLGAKAVKWLAVSLTGIGGLIFLWAISQIRTQRLWRYSGLVVLLGLLWIQTAGFSRNIPQVDVVEKIHILQYGLLAYLLYRAFKPAGNLAVLVLTLLWVAIAGTFEEGVQWFVQSRLGEFRDVAINIFAGVCGWLLALILHPPKTWDWQLDAISWRRIWRSAAIMVLAFGLFFNAAHLGYEIHDEEIGRFLSWHSKDELLDVSRQRAEQWAEDPPTELDPWAPEDYFMTEASWHVNHRNSSYENGLDFLAWQANRILEKYYDPFLELSSFRTGDPHRYALDRRERLEERARGQGTPATYRSPVLENRIFIWPSKPLLFGLLIPLAMLLWAIGSRRATS